jgi:hypothetical protein
MSDDISSEGFFEPGSLTFMGAEPLTSQSIGLTVAM